MEYKEIEDDEYSTVTTTNQKLSWVYFIIFMSLLGLVYIYYIDSQHIRKNTSSRIPSRRTPADNKIISNITVPPSSRIPSRRTPADNKNISDITASGDFESQGNKILLDDYSNSPSLLYLRPKRSSSQSYDSSATFSPASRSSSQTTFIPASRPSRSSSQSYDSSAKSEGSSFYSLDSRHSRSSSQSYD